MDNSVYCGIAITVFIFFSSLVINRSSISINRSLREFSLSQVITLFIFGQIISLLIFSITTLWVEYPLIGVIYTKDSKGEWVKNEGRVYHRFLKGDEDTIKVFSFTFPDQGTVRLYENSPFIVKYHVEEKNIPTLLKYVDTTGIDRVEPLIKQKSYKLFFITPIESLKDDKLRNLIFQRYYLPYGITVDSDDFQ